MMTLSETRQAFYATMRRYTNTTGAWHPNRLAEFIRSQAYRDYNIMERAAAEERDPTKLAQLVDQMNDILDAIEQDAA